MQSKESKDKVKHWFKEARSIYNFIHWEECLELKPKLKLIKNDDTTQTLEVTKCKVMKKAI